jgi:hypothetical protein
LAGRTRDEIEQASPGKTRLRDESVPVMDIAARWLKRAIAPTVDCREVFGISTRRAPATGGPRARTRFKNMKPATFAAGLVNCWKNVLF